MKNYDFIIGPTDTDSISFCKSDMSPYSKEEIDSLVKELNDISPEFMDWDNDGYYMSCLALKAKNYILWDGKKKTIKGSAFKTSSKELALKDMMQDIVDEMLNDNRVEAINNIYHKYIKEALNPADIKRWAQKKTVTKPILNCEGYKHHKEVIPSWNVSEPNTIKNIYKNPKGEILGLAQVKIYDAIHGRNMQEGDKIYLYPCIKSQSVEITELKNGKIKEKVIKDVGLKCIEDYSGDVDSEKLIERVYATLDIFKTILDMNQFIDYSLVKNKHLLGEL